MGLCCSATQEAVKNEEQQQTQGKPRIKASSSNQNTTMNTQNNKSSSLYSILGSSADIVQWKTVPDINYVKLFIMPEEQLIDVNNFHMLKVLGRGSQGKVILVEHKNTKQLYAMKIICKSEQQKCYIKAEKDIMKTIYHPFLVQLHYAFQTDSKVYLIMDFVIGGELFHHLRRSAQFSEDKVRFYAAELIVALRKLHENQVIYRDLKPENILIDIEGHIKLTDFGIAKILCDEEKTFTLCGTPEYVAPEVILQQGYGQSVDWYSLVKQYILKNYKFREHLCMKCQQASLLFTLGISRLCNASSYIQLTIFRITQKVSQPVPMRQHFSENAQSLLKGLLDPNPHSRLNEQQIMSHPFFEQIDWELVEVRGLSVPFVPKVENKFDLKNFDDSFTKLSCKDTPISNTHITAQKYDSFSFNIESLNNYQQLK